MSRMRAQFRHIELRRQTGSVFGNFSYLVSSVPSGVCIMDRRIDASKQNPLATQVGRSNEGCYKVVTRPSLSPGTERHGRRITGLQRLSGWVDKIGSRGLRER